MRTEVLAGQYVDLRTQAGGEESVEAALRINRLKTAGYTVSGPLRLGASLAGACADLVAAYDAFGADIGLAFQLRDDLLGVFGDPAVTGKPAGDDLREGKRTLLLAEALRGADPASAARLRAAIGDKSLSAAGLDEVRDLLVGLGAVAAVEARIDRLTDSALVVLDTAPITDEVSARLADLAISAAKRDR
jgi:geranylgeranyl diphosphate synthase type I